jgi:hypothetical protein
MVKASDCSVQKKLRVGLCKLNAHMYASINMSGFKSKYNQTMPNSLEASSPKEYVIRITQYTCLDWTILEVTWSRQGTAHYKKKEGWLVQIKCTHICIDQHARIQMKVQPYNAQFTSGFFTKRTWRIKPTHMRAQEDQNKKHIRVQVPESYFWKRSHSFRKCSRYF